MVLCQASRYKNEGNVLAPDESVHHVLVSGISELHDNIVDGGGKPGVSNQCESERMRLLHPWPPSPTATME